MLTRAPNGPGQLPTISDRIRFEACATDMFTAKDRELDIWLRDPWTSPWGYPLRPEIVNRSHITVLVCGTPRDLQQMKLTERPSDIPQWLKIICSEKRIETPEIRTVENIGQFWPAFYGTEEYFSTTGVAIPALVVTGGVMKHLVPPKPDEPDSGNMLFDWPISRRLRTIAERYQIPCSFWSPT